MPYYSDVTEDDEPMAEVYTTVGAVSDAFEEDAVDDADLARRGIDADIARMLRDNRNSRAGKALHGGAQDELVIYGGMHVWAGVKVALEQTFPGWPGPNAEWEMFHSRVMPFLRQAKQAKAGGQRPDAAAFFAGQPQCRQWFELFLANSPFRNAREKPHFHYSILKIMVSGVKYVSAEKRQKYLVDIGPMITRNGAPFDTKQLFDRKKGTNVRGTAGANVRGDLKGERCLWVMVSKGDAEFEFFSHFGKLGRFHHSSFSAGSPVVAAGEWFVAQGKCGLINACSGHYRPEPWRFVNALRFLSAAGAIDGSTEVQVWAKQGGDEQRMSAVQFINTAAQMLSTYNLFP